MATVVYPHTMTKGVFKGRTFQSGKEYQAALKKLPQVPAQRHQGSASFHLEVVTVDGTRYAVSAEAQSDQGLLDALNKHLRVLFPADK